MLVIVVPTLVVVAAVATLSLLGRRLESELGALRHALRRVGAAAIAADELARRSTVVNDRVVATAEDARVRLRRRRTVARRHPR